MSNYDSIMQVIAEHGSGNDILELSKLIKSSNPNAPIARVPLMKINHDISDNIYECLGFTPNETFKAIAEKHEKADEKYLVTKTSHILDEILKDEELIEQMACLFLLTIKSLPPQIIKMALGAGHE